MCATARRKRFLPSIIFTFATALLSAAGARANVTLPDVLSDGMVLQRDRAVPVWARPIRARW